MYEKLFSKGGLSLERFRALVEVHDAGSISATSPGDPSRQSLYSRQLRELAEYFGCEMTERKGKAIKLTRNGVKLVELVRPFLSGLDDLRTECLGDHPMFSVAAGDSLIQWLLIPRLGAVAKILPGIRFSTLSLKTNEIIAQVTDGRVDFGIVRKNAVLTGLKSAALGTMEYKAIVPHQLESSNTSPTFKDVFCRLPHAMQTTDGQFTQQLLEIAGSLNSAFSPTLGCESFPQIMAAVKSGCFCAILPELAVEDLKAGPVYRIAHPMLSKLKREIVLVWNPRVIHVRPHASKVVNSMEKALKF
jgi:DNA-binding transcriptional LysR family regulator